MSKKRKSNKMKNESGIKECTYFIDGMHCSSCEILIEKKLIKEDNIESVDATLNDSKVTFHYEGQKPSPDYLSELFKESGYVFSDRKFIHEKDVPALKVVNGKLVISKKKILSIVKVLFAIIFVLLVVRMIQNSPLASSFVLNGNSSYSSFFLFGILAGLSSCAALVGGLLLSLSKQWSELYIAENNNIQKYQPFTMFNIGRIIAFIVLGGLLGMLGSFFGLSITKAPVFTATVVIAVSLVMLILGLQMLGVKWAFKFKVALPKFLTRSVSSQEKFKGKYMPFIVGALTFFLPCGFTLIAQGLALSSGSFLRGSLMLFSFVLGTLPILAIISFTSVNLTQRPKLNALFSTFSGLLVVIFAIYNINAQFNVLGFVSISDIKLPTISAQVKEGRVNGNGNAETVQPDANGIQNLTFVAKDFAYTPTSLTTIKAGIPAKLIIDNQGIQGCGVYVSARGLLDKYAFLNAGENVFDLGLPVKGTYKLTCSMGMVPPVTIKVI